MANNKYNWDIYRIKFINDPNPNLSVGEFGRREGIPKGTLMSRAREDKWVEQRAQKYSSLTEKVSSEIFEYEADRIKKIRAKVYDIVDAFLEGLDPNDPESIEKIRSMSVKDVSALMKMVKVNSISSLEQNNTYNIADGKREESSLIEMDDEEFANYIKSKGKDISDI